NGVDNFEGGRQYPAPQFFRGNSRRCRNGVRPERGRLARPAAVPALVGKQKGQSVMHTLGKILVFLNLLVALIVAAFLLIDYQMRTNWKKYADEAKTSLEVAQRNNTTLQETIKDLHKKLVDAEQKVKAEQDGRVKDAAVYAKKLKDAGGSNAN